MQRIIIHVDIDYFYAQVEELRKPELKGKPVAVCMFSGRTQDSGAVATSNYPARDLGIRAGMPIVFAKKKAPNAVFLPADIGHYEEVSGRVMEILREFPDKFEQVSRDEAYLDITAKAGGSIIEGKRIALDVKRKVFSEEKLTCSVGVGPNKLIAKMASGVNKPDGVTVVSQIEVKSFLRARRISDLHGIGDKTVEALAQKDIRTIVQLAQAPVAQLQEMFGENKGKIIHDKALGIDESPVEEKEAQQFSRITTLKEDTSSAEKLCEESAPLAKQLAEKAVGRKVFFKTVSVILISNRLESLTRSKTLEFPVQDKTEILKAAEGLFREFFVQRPDFAARRFGLRVSNFHEPKKQKSIFEFS